MNDRHPLDWYPGDESESRTVEEANRWVEEMLTRRKMIKYKRDAGVLEAQPAPNTTNLTREIVMPSKDITRRRAVSRAHHVRALARNLAFITEVNARTTCAHCGIQPIEWHNPEHVLPGRALYRIGHMVRTVRAIAAIQAELDRCTPLCRRCHMIEDGRLRKFKQMASKPKPRGPMLPCANCLRLAKPLRRDLCSTCSSRQRYYRKTESGENVGAVLARERARAQGVRPAGKASHCRAGHPLVDGNILLESNGARRCKTCRQAYLKAKQGR